MFFFCWNSHLYHVLSFLDTIYDIIIHMVNYCYIFIYLLHCEDYQAHTIRGKFRRHSHFHFIIQRYITVSPSKLFFLEIVTHVQTMQVHEMTLKQYVAWRWDNMRSMHACVRACRVHAAMKCKHSHVLQGNTCRAVPVKINHASRGRRSFQREQATMAGRNSRKRPKFETLVS